MSRYKGFTARFKRATAAGKARMASNILTPPLEGQEQAAFFERVALNLGNYPELEAIRSFPNEGVWGAGAARLHRQGASSGPLDVLFPQPRGLYTGLWIEFKRERDGRWSGSQIKYGRQMLAWGWCVVEARSADRAWLKLMRYLALPPRVCCPVELDGLEPPEVLHDEAE